MNYGIYFEITFNWRWIITGNPIEFFNSRKVKEEVKICSENLSFTIIDIDNSIINTNDKSQTPDHSLIPISQKSWSKILQFSSSISKTISKTQDDNTNIDLSPISLCTNTNQNPGKMHVNRALNYTCIVLFFSKRKPHPVPLLPACQGMQKRGGKRGIFAVKLRKLWM